MCVCVCVVLELYSLIAGLLHRDPTERMTLEELLQDPWIRQPVNLAEYSWSEVFPCNHGTHTYTHKPLLLGLIFLLDVCEHSSHVTRRVLGLIWTCGGLKATFTMTKR